MKLVVALCLAAPAAGFGFGKKGAKAAPKAQKRSSSGARSTLSVGAAVDDDAADGSLVGDVGFDPLGFSKYAPGAWWVGVRGRRLAQDLPRGSSSCTAASPCSRRSAGSSPRSRTGRRHRTEVFAKMNPFGRSTPSPRRAGTRSSASWSPARSGASTSSRTRPTCPATPGSARPECVGHSARFGFHVHAVEYREKQLQEIKPQPRDARHRRPRGHPRARATSGTADGESFSLLL